MRVIIVCSGTISDYEKTKHIIKPSDYIICADGGYDHAMKMGIVPNVLIGDMDSIKSDKLIDNVIKHPVRKDDTDSELAVKYAINMGCDEIIMIGCIGTRLDHTITNIFLLKQILESGIKGVVIDENNEIYMIDKYIKICGNTGDIVSVIPVSGNIEGLTETGLSYCAKNTKLLFGTSLGVSNYMIGEECEITIKGGLALVIKSKD